MRACGRCGEIKPDAEFAWRRKARGERQKYCRPCQADYGREHYRTNRAAYIERARTRKQRVNRERMELLFTYFASNPCVDCGEVDPLVLEFDHLRDKTFTIGTAFRDRNWADVVAEMAKCEVVCANCHRRRTARRQGFIRESSRLKWCNSSSGSSRGL